jgi:hypothetical protein
MHSLATRLVSVATLGSMLATASIGASVPPNVLGRSVILLEEEDEPLAPDGRPGFGTKGTAREVGRKFRSPSADESRFLKALMDLPGEILVIREMARRTYLQKGYFKLLESRTSGELADLYKGFDEEVGKAESVFANRGAGAELLASMMTDLRFQLREDLLRIYEDESPELRRGLGILAGSQNGFYDLKDGEVRAITKRVDLSAARLRAVRSDLDALRERGESRAPGEADPEWEQELLALRGIPTEAERVKALRGIQMKVNGRKRRLESMLFTPRLEPQVKSDLDRRRALQDQAELHLERVKTYLLIPPFDQNPTKELLDMPHGERHRFAMSEGLRGLDSDPMNAELCYWTGMAAWEFLDARHSRPWFDRFLALRGIRSDEQGTLKDRELTDYEKNALEKVLSAFLGGPTVPR